MGCGNSAPDKAQDGAVQRELALDERKAKAAKKLLLLGAGGSGKSTFFKQLQQVYGEGFTSRERMNFRSKIYEQIISQMQLLISKCRSLGGDDCDRRMDEPIDEDALSNGDYSQMRISSENTAAAQFISQLAVTSEINAEICENIKMLWSDPGIKAAWSIRAQLCVVDSTEYFFDAIDRISDSEFVPSDDDLLYNRYMTTGMTEKEFKIQDTKFVIVDVGGQRSERRKWIHFFDGVTAVLFVASLSCYDEVLFEDQTKNVMHETLDVFEKTWNSPWFQDVATILFLNKNDLFQEKLKTKNLKICFPQYPGTNNYEDSLQFIQDIFENFCANDERNIYTHVTCATDPNNVRKVFNDVQHIVINNSLQNSGIL